MAHFITRKPSAEFEAYGEATIGSYDRIKFEGAGGGSLSDTVRGRVSFLHDQNNGYQVDQIRGGKAASANIEAYRLQLDIDLSAEAYLYLNLHGANMDNTPTIDSTVAVIYRPNAPPIYLFDDHQPKRHGINVDQYLAGELYT